MGRTVYEAPRPGRKHTIMSQEDREKGKPTVWDEMEIKGNVKNLSLSLFNYTHLRVLYMNDNQLQRIPVEIARLHKLQVLDLSNNRLRGLPAELGDMPELRVLKMDSNQLRQLPYELGRLFQLEELGLANNPLNPDLQQLYETGVPAFLQFMLDRLRSETEEERKERRDFENSLYDQLSDDEIQQEEAQGNWLNGVNVTYHNPNAAYSAAQYYQHVQQTKQNAGGQHAEQPYDEVVQQPSSVQWNRSAQPRWASEVTAGHGISHQRSARASSLPKEWYQSSQKGWPQPVHVSTPHQSGVSVSQHWLQQKQQLQQQKLQQLQQLQQQVQQQQVQQQQAQQQQVQQQQVKQQQVQQQQAQQQQVQQQQVQQQQVQQQQVQQRQPTSNLTFQAAPLARQWQYSSSGSLPSYTQQSTYTMNQQQSDMNHLQPLPARTMHHTQQPSTSFLMPQSKTTQHPAQQHPMSSYRQQCNMGRTQQQRPIVPQQWQQQQQFQFVSGSTSAANSVNRPNMGHISDAEDVYQERTSVMNNHQ